jgi:hypothetical protein
MNEFFSSTWGAKLKNGETPELVVATQVYVYFTIAAIVSGLLIIIAAHYYGKR